MLIPPISNSDISGSEDCSDRRFADLGRKPRLAFQLKIFSRIDSSQFLRQGCLEIAFQSGDRQTRMLSGLAPRPI